MPSLKDLVLLTAGAISIAAFSVHVRAHVGHDHHVAAAGPEYTTQLAPYKLPEASLVRADGASVSFRKEIDDGKPVVLTFIYTTCTSVCPILSHNVAEFQRKLGPERTKLNVISISIDPEQDTPERLAEYGQRYGAQAEWRFYTGSLRASIALQRAFHAYFGDKMHHRPVTFMRAAPGQPWLRLEGFATADDLVMEYRRLAAH